MMYKILPKIENVSWVCIQLVHVWILHSLVEPRESFRIDFVRKHFDRIPCRTSTRGWTLLHFIGAFHNTINELGFESLGVCTCNLRCVSFKPNSLFPFQRCFYISAFVPVSFSSLYHIIYYFLNDDAPTVQGSFAPQRR